MADADKPLISVVTVCFNSASHIADALASVDAQSWPVKEHLIVDGASRDTTLEVVARFAQPWRRVVSEPDKGIFDAMNKGIRLARGDIIGFINSDDFLADADVLAQVAKVFEDPTIDAVWGDLCYVRQNDTTQVVRYWKSSPFKPGLFGRGWCPPHPTLYVRRSVYDRCGHFDLKYAIAGDVELMARMLEVHHVRSHYIPRVLVRMRMGGTSNRNLSNILQQNREIWDALKKHSLQPLLLTFIASKLASRGRQFLTRPGQ